LACSVGQIETNEAVVVRKPSLVQMDVSHTLRLHYVL
jgi:hypothetical protein